MQKKHKKETGKKTKNMPCELYVSTNLTKPPMSVMLVASVGTDFYRTLPTLSSNSNVNFRFLDLVLLKCGM